MSFALDAVIDDFKSDVNRVESLLHLVKLFRKFGASEPPSLGSEAANWAEALGLHLDSKERRTDLPIFAGSLLLYLVGRFEFCIRQIVERIADDISSKAGKYEDLPPQIQKTLRQRTLDIAQNPKKFGHDDTTADSFLESLLDNMKNKNGIISIKTEILSITETNLRPQAMSELLKVVGITDIWRDIGRQNKMKIFLEKTLDQEASAEGQSRLNKIMDERNQIAHPTSQTIFPDADQVLDHAKYLIVLADQVIDLSKIHLVEYKRKISSPPP